MVRYLNLSLVLILRSISSAVKKRFPTLDHLVEAGFMTSEEFLMFNMVPNKEFNTYWVPCTWFTSLLKEAKNQKRLLDPSAIKLLMEEFCEFRNKCGMLWSYDWVSIPLVYTQVVTIATYIFFLAAIIGRQFVEKSPNPYRHMIDLYVPFFTLLQFFFYMGLLKVAEQLINPFGDDDEDFELNWIIDRHVKVSYLIVDTLIGRAPPLAKDIFFDEESPVLPYTEASAAFKKKTFRGSVANMIVPEEKQHLILPDIVEDGEGESSAMDGSQSRCKSLMKQANSILKASRNHLNVHGPEVSKDGHRASIQDCNLLYSGNSSRRSSCRSATPPLKFPQRRQSTAGSKGISSGLVSLGSNQAVFGADWSHVEEKGSSDGLEEGMSSIPGRKESTVRSEESLDRLYLPYKDVCVNIDDPNLRSSSESLHRLRELMPASLQAKLAVKNKPVMTWKPYQRPNKHSSSNSALPLDLEKLEAIPTVVLEEESSFMWQTIDEESESLTTANSDPAFNDQPNCAELRLTVEKDSPLQKHLKTGVTTEASESMLASKSNLFKTDRRSYSVRSTRNRRPHYKVKGRTRWSSLPSFYTYTSMPYIPLCNCGHGAISLKHLKSLSEASVFLEAISNKVQELKALEINAKMPLGNVGHSKYSRKTKSVDFVGGQET